jgi:hypothetical protein
LSAIPLHCSAEHIEGVNIALCCVTDTDFVFSVLRLIKDLTSPSAPSFTRKVGSKLKKVGCGHPA